MRIVLLLLLLGSAALAQHFEGAWYGLAPAGLIEIAIDCDSIRIKQVDVNGANMSLAARYTHGAKLQLAQTVTLNDRYLLIVRQGLDSARFAALVLFDYVPGQRLQLAWNAPDTTARSPQLLLRHYTGSRRKLLGAYFYSARFISTLRRLRPIDEMTKAEFDHYFERYAEKIRQANRELEANEPNYRFKFVDELKLWVFTLNTQTLYEEGFCPLQSEYDVLELYLKFYSAKQMAKKVAATMK